MLESYPQAEKRFASKPSEKKADLLYAMIRDARSYKAENKLAPNAPISLVISPKAPFPGIEAYLTRFAFAKKVEFSSASPKGESFSYDGFALVIENEVDEGKLKESLTSEKETLLSEIARGEKMLNNPGFLAKAPKEKVALEKEKLEANKNKLALVEEKLSKLK